MILSTELILFKNWSTTSMYNDGNPLFNNFNLNNNACRYLLLFYSGSEYFVSASLSDLPPVAMSKCKCRCRVSQPFFFIICSKTYKGYHISKFSA